MTRVIHIDHLVVDGLDAEQAARLRPALIAALERRLAEAPDGGGDLVRPILRADVPGGDVQVTADRIAAVVARGLGGAT